MPQAASTNPSGILCGWKQRNGADTLTAICPKSNKQATLNKRLTAYSVMGRKPTGRTTKLIRVPVHFEDQVKTLIKKLKAQEGRSEQYVGEVWNNTSTTGVAHE